MINRHRIFITDDDDQSSQHGSKTISFYNIYTTEFVSGCDDIYSASGVSRK